ncbi:hypothetical protein ACLMJK_000394 [Lecanora helva]
MNIPEIQQISTRLHHSKIKALIVQATARIETTIINDLSKERPQWLLSAYGAGREAPIQLFGGSPREQSFEELRLRHYQLAAQGRHQEAIQEAQTLVNIAEQQNQTALNDIDSAITYIINGEREHPNRIDIVNAKGNQPQQSEVMNQNQPSVPAFGQPSSTFGRPAAPAFGQPSFGSSFGQPSALGQSAAMGRPATSFGQSSGFGNPSVFAPTFGRPSPFGAQQQGPSPFTSLSGQNAQAQTSLSANQPSNPFGQPFGKPSAPSQSGNPPGSFSLNPLDQSAPNAFAPSSTNQTSKTSISFANRAVPSFGFNFESFQSSHIPSNSANFTKAQPTTNSRIDVASTTAVNANASGAVDDATVKISNWKGKPVSYIDEEPCYRTNDGSWRRIWFPHGAPSFAKTPELPVEAYNESIKEEYGSAKEHGLFKDGIMPKLPPRREWCTWDF